MLYALVLGLWGIMSLVIFGIALSTPSLSLFSTIIMFSTPLLALYLTFRFRKNVTFDDESFSFTRGYVFTFFMGIYASLLVAVFVFIYLAFFDGGYIFDSYEAVLSQPDSLSQLRSSGILAQLEEAGGSVHEIVNTMREISPIYYAALIINFTLLCAPVISLLIAWICARRSALLRNF